MRRSRSPASSYCSASGRDNSDWDVWAFKVKLRLRSGTPYLALEVSAAQKGSAFARDGYLHQSQGFNSCRPALRAIGQPSFDGIPDLGCDLDAGEPCDFLDAGRRGDVDLGQPVADHVDADKDEPLGA